MTYELSFPETGAAVVFGGSGGAGSAICRGLAKAGANVAFTYLSNEEKAQSLLAELESVGVQASADRLDLSELEQTRAVVEAIAERYGEIHTVVYASGPSFETIPICEVAPDVFRGIVDVELNGFFNILHASVPYLRRTAGTIVACVTFANHRVLEMDGQSAAPKAGIESLVRQVAVEEAQHGVRANSVGLGWMNFGLGALDDSERTMIKGEVGRQAAAVMASRIRLGQRPGEGEELASAVVFLASEQASYITGQVLDVDGGITL